MYVHIICNYPTWIQKFVTKENIETSIAAEIENHIFSQERDKNC